MESEQHGFHKHRRPFIWLEKLSTWTSKARGLKLTLSNVGFMPLSVTACSALFDVRMLYYNKRKKNELRFFFIGSVSD